MPKFTLANPIVKGTVDTTSNKKDAIEAANEIYGNISQYFANPLSEFYFTIEKNSNKSRNQDGGAKTQYFHFKVSEKHIGNDVNYALKPFTGNVNLKAFFKQVEQSGGKKHRKHSKDDDDSSSSSSSESESPLYRKIRHPIYSWWYYPSLYSLTDALTIPAFNMINAPYTIKYFPLFGSLGAEALYLD